MRNCLKKDGNEYLNLALNCSLVKFMVPTRDSPIERALIRSLGNKMPVVSMMEN